MDKAYETACTLLHHMNCHDIFPLVYSHNTNNRPAVKDPDALNGINNIVRYFNQAKARQPHIFAVITTKTILFSLVLRYTIYMEVM